MRRAPGKKKKKKKRAKNTQRKGQRSLTWLKTIQKNFDKGSECTWIRLKIACGITYYSQLKYKEEVHRRLVPFVEANFKQNAKINRSLSKSLYRNETLPHKQCTLIDRKVALLFIGRDSHDIIPKYGKYLSRRTPVEVNLTSTTAEISCICIVDHKSQKKQGIRQTILLKKDTPSG